MSEHSADDLLKELTQLSDQRLVQQADGGQSQSNQALDESEISRVIEMAWEDRTPFEAIEHQYGIPEPEVIALMRQHMHPKSFKLWRQRVTGRITKHRTLRPDDVSRAYCPTQYKHR